MAKWDNKKLKPGKEIGETLHQGEFKIIGLNHIPYISEEIIFFGWSSEIHKLLIAVTMPEGAS